MFRNDVYTAESVTEGHPDKMCDILVDAVLDAVLARDRFARVEVDAMATRGLVLVSGEVTTKTWVDITKVVRESLCRIGYDDPALGFDCGSIAVLTVIEEQPADLALAVDRRGAGNQGVFVGFATDEHRSLAVDTNYMPLPTFLAHALARRLTDLRRSGEVPWLFPDGQTQVSVHYEDGVPVRITHATASGHHRAGRDVAEVRAVLREKVLEAVLAPTGLVDAKTELLANPAGPFTIGGPMADVGISGRKQIVDHYGTICRHGGASLSGKDPTKTDRSASYMARYLAKNVVAAGLAGKCEVRLSYVIGVEQPVAVQVATFGTGAVPDERIAAALAERFDLSTAGIIELLNLRRPIFGPTACYGHFGRAGEDFTWERTDDAGDLREWAGRG
jgi:S-adenosylmethionine synthetase